jgi:threonine dehydrogenase-like Zn-dependent dehydrogenase
MREYTPLPATSSRAVLTRSGGFRLTDEPIPPVESSDLLLRLISVGLTPEDLDPAVHQNRTPPGTPVATIAAVGDKVSGWGPLDNAVILSSSLLRDYPHPGGVSEYIHVPGPLQAKDLVLKLPVGFSPDDATLIPATALATRLLAISDVPSGGSLLVVGLGLLGQITILMARHQKVERIIAADPSPTLRRRAEWSGATRLVRLPEEGLAEAVEREVGRRGIDAAIILLPEAALTYQALQGLAQGGAVVIGVPFGGSFLLTFPAAQLQDRDLRIAGVRRYRQGDLTAAIQAIREGIVSAEMLVTKRIPWEDLADTVIEDDYWESGTHVIVEAPIARQAS